MDAAYIEHYNGLRTRYAEGRMPLRNKSSAKQAVSNLSAARSTAPPRYTITAHVKLYNAVQSARLTVVLQKNVQTWSGTWDDIFVFSAGGAGSAALAHEMRLSSGVYRAKIIADVVRSGRHSCGYFHCVYSGTHCFLTQTLPHKAKAGQCPALALSYPSKAFPNEIRTKRHVSAVSCAHFPMDK